MSRIRTIKPEFWISEQVMSCSHSARLLFIGLWNFCDDGGVHPANLRKLKAEVFPGDDVTLSDVDGWMKELIEQRLVAEFAAPYHNEPCTFWFVTGWKHQRIDKPYLKYPPYPARQGSPTVPQPFDDPSPTIPRTLDEHSAQGVDRKGKEGNGTGKEGSETAPVPARHARAPKTPLPADLAITPQLRVWAEQHGYGDLAAHLDHFRDKATANGYQYADWMAAFRNAVRDDWAGLRKKPAGATTQPDPPLSRLSKAGEQQRRNLEVWLQQDPAEAVAHELH
jgi:hypothetical protein